MQKRQINANQDLSLRLLHHRLNKSKERSIEKRNFGRSLHFWTFLYCSIPNGSNVSSGSGPQNFGNAHVPSSKEDTKEESGAKEEEDQPNTVRHHSIVPCIGSFYLSYRNHL